MHGFIALLGRIFYSYIFISSSLNHFSEGAIQYAASKGVPFPEYLVPLSGIIAFLGGLSILLGIKAKCGAWLIVLFLVPVTLMMHQFWGIDQSAAGTQYLFFVKNLSMLGAALLITQVGPGPWSVDSWLEKK